MTNALVPSSKLGTPFQSPSWRFQVISQPEKFGLEWICSKRESNAGHLTRLIPKGLRPATNYNLPDYFKQLSSRLPAHLYTTLIKVWNKHYYSDNLRKTTFTSSTSNRVPLSINVKAVQKLNDDFLKKAILHCFNYEGDPYIQEAILCFKDSNNTQTRDWLSYFIYAGLSDKAIAVAWEKPVRMIQAFRLLFFDFSHWPKEKFVHYALIRQLVNNGELRDEQYHMFRRIFDLGLVGLKSITGVHTLNAEEKLQVDNYLGSKATGNVLDLSFTIENSKDAVTFNQVFSGAATVGLKRLEVEQKSALVKLHTMKAAKEMGMSEETSTTTFEQELIDHLREAAKFDHTPKFPAFTELKAEELINKG